MEEFKYIYLKSRFDVRAAILSLNAFNDPIVLDIETTGLNRFTDKIISYQLCRVGATYAYYIDEEYCDELEKLTTPLVLHNFKFDFAFLRHSKKIDLRRVGMSRRAVEDTMLLHHLLDENADHSLDAIVKEKWNDNYKESFWTTYKSFQEAPEPARIEYACKDTIYTGYLYKELRESLRMQHISDALIGHVSNLASALYDTEVQGVRVDLDYLSERGRDVIERIETLRNEMSLLVPNETALIENDLWVKELEKRKTPKGRAGVKKPVFNWDSNVQQKELIYGKLGLNPIVKKHKGQKEARPTLDDAALAELEGQHEIIKTLREYKENQKVYGSFIEGTFERQIGGRIYPSFNVNGTVTGRISSSNPNLQQLPREGGIRGIYVPEQGRSFISCDYGQLEVVIAAHYSRDANLLSIIYEGTSKHDITAKALGIPRQTAKTINFAIGYGATEFKIKDILGCSINSAKDALKMYWEAYKDEKKVIDECRKRVDDGLPIINLFGRRRRFPVQFSDRWKKESAYRQAYSSLVQGTGADCTHTAFYQVSDYLRQAGIGRALFEVHDEILIEVKDEYVEQARAELQRIMINVGVEAGLSVPLTVDCSGAMKRWED